MGRAAPPEFEVARHVAFVEAMMEELPEDYATQEANRLTLAYFSVASLALLRSLHRVNKEQFVDWVLSFQVHQRKNDCLENGQFYGFCASRTTQFPVNCSEDSCPNGSHLASTYCALAMLKMVGHDLSNIDSETLLTSMRKLQQPNGSFMPIHIGAEKDLRFLYCAAAICSMLNSWTGMDKEKAKNFILECQTFDGGFSLTPGAESHGGATYCAVAALRLMGFIGYGTILNSLETSLIDVPLLLSWCLQRQADDGGFRGRINKPSDTCYAFWVGGVLKILGAYHLLDCHSLRKFLLTCQSPYGGFTKFPRERIPDLYHTYYGYAALAMLGEEGIAHLCPELGIAVSDS